MWQASLSLHRKQESHERHSNTHSDRKMQESFIQHFPGEKCILHFENTVFTLVYSLVPVVREPRVKKSNSMSLAIAVVLNCLTSWKWESIHLHKVACVYSIPLGRNRFFFPCTAWFLFLLQRQFTEVRNKDESSYVWQTICKRRV
jgi:hypothetical protein